jgi:uncharacterized membrane protein YjgN (DUF898 family)
MAILAPVYVLYFVVGIEAERAHAYASVPIILFYYLFGQFAIYRARRYRLTRTVWRGVRFWMDGSGWEYAARGALGRTGGADARARMAVARGRTGALQDAPFLVWRSASQL